MRRPIRNIFVLTLTLTTMSLLIGLLWRCSARGRQAALPDILTREPVESWEEADGLNTYTYELTLDPDEHCLSGHMTLDYENRENDVLTELHFALFANSFGQKEYGIFSADEFQLAYPNGFSPGYIHIFDVCLDHQPGKYRITGKKSKYWWCCCLRLCSRENRQILQAAVRHHRGFSLL